jgi:hypothetical protein
MRTVPWGCVPIVRRAESTRPIPVATEPMLRRAAPELSSPRSHPSLYRRLQQRRHRIRMTIPRGVYLEGRLPALLSARSWASASSQHLFSDFLFIEGGEAVAKTEASLTSHHPLDMGHHHRWDRPTHRLGLRCCLVVGSLGCLPSKAIPATRRPVTRPGTCTVRSPEPRLGIVGAGGEATTIHLPMGSALARHLSAARACSDRPRQC